MPLLTFNPQTMGLLSDTLTGIGMGLLNQQPNSAGRYSALGGIGQGLQYTQGLQQQRRNALSDKLRDQIAQQQLTLQQQQAERQRQQDQREQERIAAQQRAVQSLFGGAPQSSEGAWTAPNGMTFGEPRSGATPSAPSPALSGYSPEQLAFLQSYSQADPGGALGIVAQNTFPKPADQPATVKEYQYAVEHDGYQGSLTDFIKERARAGANTTTINMPPAEKSYNTELGKLEAGDIDALTTSANQSRGQLDALNTLDALRTALQKSGNDVGALAPIKQQVGAMANALGVQVGNLNDSAGLYEAMNAMTNKLALSNIGGGGKEGGLPANNFSEADRNFIVKMSPQLGDTPQGFSAKMEILKRSAQRNVEKEALWNSGNYDQLSEQDLRRFKSDWAKYVAAHPLFSEQEKNAFQSLTGAKTTPPVNSHPNPQIAPVVVPQLPGSGWQ